MTARPAVQRWNAFGPGPDAPLNQMDLPAGTRATMIPDIQGSIIGTLDTGTAALTKTGYQPYGENPANLTGAFRYTARRLDPETGGATAQPSGLYYYRARMYSPTWGRFLQPDPIGYAAGNNLYAYVNNDPLNATDPDGLAQVEIRYNPIALTGYIASHSYIVVSESDGSNPIVFRAGPGNMGTIFAQSGPYLPGFTPDYTTSPRATVAIINDNLPASYYEQKLQNFELSVNVAAIPYSPLTTNSNAYAAQAIETLGVARPEAPTLAPGFQTVLPLTPSPGSLLIPSTAPGFSNPAFSSASSTPGK
jgi:RHS repeat-associated protein